MFMLMPAFSEESYCSLSLEGQKSVLISLGKAVANLL